MRKRGGASCSNSPVSHERAGNGTFGSADARVKPSSHPRALEPGARYTNRMPKAYALGILYLNA